MTISEYLETVAAFGGDGTAVTRLAWSAELARAASWFEDRLAIAGLETSVDAAGNVIGRWHAGGDRAVVVGSHLDTVPNGGRFDGALGVLGALAAVELLQAEHFQPLRPIWIVAFMDEEGARFGTSLFGSRAFTGVDLRQTLGLVDASGVTLSDAIAEYGLAARALPSAKAIDSVSSFLELHIEQGPRLALSDTELGIVTAVVGLLQAEVELRGEANHAGTTPMDGRRDALAGAAQVLLALRRQAKGSDTDMTATVGSLEVEPGAANVIPARCTFTVDLRTSSEGAFAALGPLVERTVFDVARREGLDADVRVLSSDEPVQFDEGIIESLERAADLERAERMRLLSGAGHDAMILAGHVPSGLLFVPSRGGVSHSPAEHTEPRHCETGVRVLARAIRALAG